MTKKERKIIENLKKHKSIDYNSVYSLDDCPFADIEYAAVDWGKHFYGCTHPDKENEECCRDGQTYEGCPLKNKPILIQLSPLTKEEK